MPIIHNKVTENYSVVSNSILRFNKLSWRAKGIYAYLVGCKSGFEVSYATLMSLGKEGRDAIMSAVKELKDCGCLEIEAHQSNNGELDGHNWVVTELLKNRITGNPTYGESAPNKSIDNNNNINNNISSPSASEEEEKAAEAAKSIATRYNGALAALATPIAPPTVKTPSSSTLEPKNTIQQSSHDLDFEAWWSAYPRKVGKGQARTAYARALKKATTDELLDGAMLMQHSLKTKRIDPQYVPHPTTWLNGERWADEVSPMSFKPTSDVVADERKWAAEKERINKTPQWMQKNTERFVNPLKTVDNYAVTKLKKERAWLESMVANRDTETEKTWRWYWTSDHVKGMSAPEQTKESLDNFFKNLENNC